MTGLVATTSAGGRLDRSEQAGGLEQPPRYSSTTALEFIAIQTRAIQTRLQVALLATRQLFF